MAVWFWPEPGYGAIGSLQQHWPLNHVPSFASHFAMWDAGHYLYISVVGYKAEDSACAFYPLFPLCVRWFSDLFHGRMVGERMASLGRLPEKSITPKPR